MPRNMRKCILCDLNDIGDEFHYILICKFFDEERKKHIDEKYYTNPNVIKFRNLFENLKGVRLLNLAKFCQIIMLYSKK